MRYRARLCLLVLCTLVLEGCASTPKAESVEGELRGMVYDIDRQPILDATVTVAGPDRLSGLTDLHGRFGVAPVRFGEVTLEVMKPGYEPIHWTFQFRNSAQVVYLQLASIDQLFDRAAAALEKKDWRTFQLFLERAKKLAPSSLQGVILEATGLELHGDLDGAIGILENEQPEQPVLALELFLGDLYAKRGDDQKAISHWTSALAIREDSTVRAKIEKLKAGK